MSRTTRWLVALLGAFALALAGCTSSSEPQEAGAAQGSDAGAAAVGGDEQTTVAEPGDPGEDRVAEIKERGSLIVGMTLQFEPQMYVDENNEPAGYDVELVRLLAEDLGVELDIRDLEFDALIPGLLAGEFDLVSVGLVNRPDRAEQVWFAGPYVPYRQVVVINSESGITSLDDLNSPDVRMTALTGSTAAGLITEQFPEAELAELEQQPAFLEVASGRADAIVVEEYLAVPFVEEHPGTEILNPDEPFSQEFGYWALPRGGVIWHNYLENWLAFQQANGTLQSLYTEIIGPVAEEGDFLPEFP